MHRAAESRSVVGAGGRLLLSMLMVAGLFTRTAAADALVHWLPSSDPAVVGYNVYVRAAGATYSTPRPAGLPSRSTDGTHSYRVTQLPAATTWYFAVAGYDAAGVEGRISNEIALGPTNPCALDMCYAKTSCLVMPLPDGSHCADDTPDPCAELCGLGVCGNALRTDLTTGRLLLAQGTRGVRIGGTAVFPATWGTGLGTAGIAVTVEGPSGPPIFDAFVPSDSLRSGSNGVSYRYRAPRGTTTGLLRVSTRRSDDRIKVTVRAVVPDLATDDLPDQIRWMVNVGDRCASDVGMVCSRGSGRMNCS